MGWRGTATHRTPMAQSILERSFDTHGRGCHAAKSGAAEQAGRRPPGHQKFRRNQRRGADRLPCDDGAAMG